MLLMPEDSRGNPVPVATAKILENEVQQNGRSLYSVSLIFLLPQDAGCFVCLITAVVKVFTTKRTLKISTEVFVLSARSFLHLLPISFF